MQKVIITFNNQHHIDKDITPLLNKGYKVISITETDRTLIFVLEIKK